MSWILKKKLLLTLRSNKKYIMNKASTIWKLIESKTHMIYSKNRKIFGVVGAHFYLERSYNEPILILILSWDVKVAVAMDGRRERIPAYITVDSPAVLPLTGQGPRKEGGREENEPCSCMAMHNWPWEFEKLSGGQTYIIYLHII